MLLAAEFPDQDDHLLHSGDLEHHVLYLAEFDAQAAELDLVVRASQDDDVSVRQPLGVVSGAVGASAVVFDEALAGLFLEVVVATGYAHSSDEELSDNSDRELVAVGVDDILLDVELGLSNRNQLGIGQFLVVGRHRGLGGAVAVEDARTSDLAHLGEERVAELLASCPADANLGDGLAEQVAGEPGLPAGRGSGHHIDLLVHNQGCQLERVVGLLLGGQDKCLAVIEGHTDVLECCVERYGRDAQDAVRIRKHSVGEHVGGVAVEIIADAFVAEHHALGTSRGAARIDEVRQVVAGQ